MGACGGLTDGASARREVRAWPSADGGDDANDDDLIITQVIAAIRGHGEDASRGQKRRADGTVADAGPEEMRPCASIVLSPIVGSRALPGTARAPPAGAFASSAAATMKSAIKVLARPGEQISAAHTWTPPSRAEPPRCWPVQASTDVRICAAQLGGPPAPCADRATRVCQDGTTANVPEGLVNPQDPPLSAEQRQVVELVVERCASIFFTGCAGTGKTRTLREIVARSAPATTRVTAMTGVAASALPGGSTLHSFAGIGRATDSPERLVDAILRDSFRKREWCQCKLLIVDEVSMLSQSLFEMLEYIARRVRGGDRPFGGLQLCLCGDFFQLPPMGRERGGIQFCFQSACWSQCIDCCVELTTVYRQRDASLLKLLREVRSNTVSQASVQLLQSLARPVQMHGNVMPTRLLPVNAAVDRINAEHLASLPGVPQVYRAVDHPPHLSSQLTSLTNYQEVLELKVGAQVMMLKNMGSLVNGSRGTVVDFAAGEGPTFPVVQWMSGAVSVVGHHELHYETSRGHLTRRQLPLKLGWAMTIHKAQGMSIDLLDVDISCVWEKGQAYAALSRARTLEGLRVRAFDVRRFWTDHRVVQFYHDHVKQVGDCP